MIDNKCWNDDIGSQDLYQAQQTWVDGKSGDDGHGRHRREEVREEVGGDKVGVMTMPTYAQGVGSGKLGATSQTVGITSWSPYKQQAADFIEFMHTPPG